MREQHCITPPVEDQVNAKNPHKSWFIGRLVNPPFYELHTPQYCESQQSDRYGQHELTKRQANSDCRKTAAMRLSLSLQHVVSSGA